MTDWNFHVSLKCSVQVDRAGLTLFRTDHLDSTPATVGKGTEERCKIYMYLDDSNGNVTYSAYLPCKSLLDFKFLTNTPLKIWHCKNPWNLHFVSFNKEIPRLLVLKASSIRFLPRATHFRSWSSHLKSHLYGIITRYFATLSCFCNKQRKGDQLSF